MKGRRRRSTAWIATGSKLASFVALMKVFLHALLPWSNPSSQTLGPGWLGIVAVIAAFTMTYGNFAALAQRNFKRMLAYSSIAHAGYILVGLAAASVAADNSKAVGAVLYYLVVYAFANVGRVCRGGMAGARQEDRRHRRPERPGLPGTAAVGLHPDPDALADRHPAAGGLLRQALRVHGGARRARSAPLVDPPVAGGPGTVQLGSLGVLLRARAEGDVLPGARCPPVSPGQPADRAADCPGRPAHARLRPPARLAPRHDASGGAPDAVVLVAPAEGARARSPGPARRRQEGPDRPSSTRKPSSRRWVRPRRAAP